MRDFYNDTSVKRRWTPMTGVVTLVCVSLVLIGLEHVLTKNRIHALGKQQRLIEKEISDQEQSARNLDIKIAESLTRKNLMEKLSERGTKLKGIKVENIVRLSVNTTLPSQ
jgi:cell division protein FtsL